MKKIIILLLVLGIPLGYASAQQSAKVLAASERALSYTDGDSITISDICIGKAYTYAIGAWATPQMLRSYAGCKIVGIRFAVGSSIGKSRVFLCRIQNKDVTDTIVSRPVRRTSSGWNEVRFNNSQEYVISENDSLFFGYNYTETQQMVQDGKGAIAVYKPKTDNPLASLIYVNFGMGKQPTFVSFSEKGNACVQLIVDISNKPHKDLDMESILIGNKYKQLGENIDAFLTYRNVGRDSVFSCKIGCQIDNRSPIFFNETKMLKENALESMNHMIDLPSDLPVGRHIIKFFVSTIDGQQPVSTICDTIYAPFISYATALPRQQHYVEQYTDQGNPMAPPVNQQMNIAGNDNNICLVNIHRPGTSLSLPESNYLHGLYAYTLPCFTIDRFSFFGEKHIAFDANDYIFIMPDILSQSVRQLANEANLNPAFATINFIPAYDTASRKLTLTVEGDISSDALPIFNRLALTVLIAENEVEADQMVFNSDRTSSFVKADYHHDNVMRAYLSAPMGDELQVSAGRYSVSYTSVIPAEWNVNNLKAVALITKFTTEANAGNLPELDVTNANSIFLKGIVPDGIKRTEANSPDTAAEYFTLDGRRIPISNLRQGVFIIRKGGQCRKIIIQPR